MNLVTDALAVVNKKAGKIFAFECGISRYPVYFIGSRIAIIAGSLAEAKKLYRSKYTVLGSRCWEWRQEGVEILWESLDGIKYFFIEPIPLIKLSALGEIKMSNNQPKITVPSIFVNFSQLSRPLLDALGEMIDNHDKVMGITRLADERQLFITPTLASAMKSQPDEATSRKMSDFWLASDLQQLHQLINQQGTSGFEHTYSAALDKDKQYWGRFTSKFRVIEDDFGVAYRFVEVLNLDLIEKPAFVA